MNVMVLSGSPKGESSVTLHFCKYIEQSDPGHQWQICHGARDVQHIEKEEKRRTDLWNQIEKSDLILWSFPVYYMSVPGQFKRFIDILYRSEFSDALSGKAAAILSTSIHFYDHTAHAYMRAVCRDLGMRLVGGFSASMHDLLEKKGRGKLMAHWQEWMRIHADDGEFYEPVMTEREPDALSDAHLFEGISQLGQEKTAIVGDFSRNANLKKMAVSLTGLLGEQAVMYDLSAADIRQGCLGCCRCGMENRCVQDNTDGFRRLLDEGILGADTVIFALDISNRLFSWRFKQFLDRSFCHNHVPFYKGRKMGWLVAGPLKANPQILEMMRGLEQMMECEPVGIITDELGEETCRRQLVRLASDVQVPFDEQKIPPKMFSGLAGRLVFRENIFGTMRLVFPMDHRYYRKNGYYDFPTRQWSKRLLVWVAQPLLKLKPLRKGMQKNMVKQMVQPYRKILNKLKEYRK